MSLISEMKRTEWNDNVQPYHLTIKLVWKEFSDCRYPSQHTKDSVTTSDLHYGSVYLVWGTSGTWYQAKWSQLIHIIGSTAGILLQLSTLMSCCITVGGSPTILQPRQSQDWQSPSRNRWLHEKWMRIFHDDHIFLAVIQVL